MADTNMVGALATVVERHELDRMADDGCPQADYVPQPRRPFYGLKTEARDRRKMYAALGTVLVEVVDGVYVEARLAPMLCAVDPVKDSSGRMVARVLEIMVDTK